MQITCPTMCISANLCSILFSFGNEYFFKLLKKASFDICFTDAPFVKFSMCMYSVCHELITACRNKAMTLAYTRNMHVAFRFQGIIKLFSKRLIFDTAKHFEINVIHVVDN